MARKIKLSDIGGRYADEIDQAFSRNDSLSESEAQIKLVIWCNRVKLGDEVLGEYLHHSPNEGKKETRISKAGRVYCPQGQKNKNMGTRRGYPDLVLEIARQGYHGLRIELKRKKGGRVEPEQREWIERLTKQGYKAVIARGFDEAKQIITDYMGVGRNQKHDLECDITNAENSR